MWKRDESIRSPAEADPDEDDEVTIRPKAAKRAEDEGIRVTERVNIGKSVVIKGELNGSEDLTIEGRVEGKIELRQHVLTVGPNGTIKAQVFAKAVVVLGEVNGNVTATDKVSIRENGSVDGDIAAPRVSIAEGAHFRGSVDMQRSDVPPRSRSRRRRGARDRGRPGERRHRGRNADRAFARVAR